MRVTLLRPLSGLVLDRDVLVSAPSVTESISGPADITFTVPADYAASKGEDGYPMILKLGTMVVVERSWGPPVAGIVDDVLPQGQRTQVSAGGFSMLATGCPYLGPAKSYLSTDPLAIFRTIWNHVQSYPSAALGIQVTGATSSAGRLGRPPTKAYTDAFGRFAAAEALEQREARIVYGRTLFVAAQLKKTFTVAGMNFVGKIVKSKSAPTTDKAKVLWAREAAKDEFYIYAWTAKAEKAQVKLIAQLENEYYAAKEKADKAEREGASNVNELIQKADDLKAEWDAWKKSPGWVVSGPASIAYTQYREIVADLANAKTALKVAKEAKSTAKEALSKVSDQAPDPYLVNYWTNTDCGALLGDLAQAGPFEFREQSAWEDASKVKLTRSLLVGAPRVGVRRDGLRFEIDVNVLGASLAPVHETVYTEVSQLGAGEGSKQLRASVSASAGPRIRRVLAESNTDDRTKTAVEARARAALARVEPKAAGISFDSVTVRDHPHAPLSSFEVGDEIRLIGPFPGLGRVDVWLRVLERTTDVDDKTLTLKTEAV